VTFISRRLSWLPERIKAPLRKAFHHAHKLGRSRQCPLCERKFARFIARKPSSVVDLELGIISASPLTVGECPYCRSRQRQRLLYLYLSERKLLEALGQREVLHVAPEAPLFKKLQPLAKRYVCCDVTPAKYRFTEVEQQELTKLQYADQRFDWVICNHVLEHIPDDGAAMRELCRVLHPRGAAFLTVPIGGRLTFSREDSSVTGALEREAYFGQDDHVRVYSRADFIRRLEEAGFTVTPSRPVLDKKACIRYGVSEETEEIFQAVRNAA
jgi:SAM-dependent methyltransferase